MRTHSIVLVEDDPNDQELMKLALEASDIKHTLKVFPNGEGALAHLRNMDPMSSLSLVILDLKLPKVSGLEILKELRSIPSCVHLPIVIFTSSKEEKDIRDSYAAGASAFVRKPIESEEFTEVVKVLGTFWLKLNETYV